jgi:hypothetical protein
VFAVFWLFTPAAAARLHVGRVAVCLGLGLVVQLLALTLDPHRLYIRVGLQPKVLLAYPEFHFDMRASHLLQRPREVYEVLTSPVRSEQFTPAPRPTYAIPLPDPLVDDAESLHEYHVFNSLRFWWACQWYLPPDERPVDLARALAILLGLAASGAGLMAAGLRGGAPQCR